MGINVNVEYVLRETERVEDEQRDISLRIVAWIYRCAALTAFRAERTSETEAEQRNISIRVAAWVERCEALTTFRAELTDEELSQVTRERARRVTAHRRRTSERVLVAVNEQTSGGKDARRTTTECALQSAR
jgi:hypothetical protein